MTNLVYCPKCLGNGVKSYEVPKFGVNLEVYTICNGFYEISYFSDKNHCSQCGTGLITLDITDEEWHCIQKISTDPNLILALDKLKKEDIIEYNIKLAQFKQTSESVKQTEEIKQQTTKQDSNVPKCPTCGSTHIKKISGTKRWVGVGLFGVASSDMGKTMQCENCGYKW